MPKYELLIAVIDEIDHTIGKVRKKEGDIIAIRPHPWNWGRKEIDEYLIVIAEIDKDYNYLRQIIQQQVYQNINTLALITESEYENGLETQTIDPNDYQFYAKNRYKVDLNTIKLSLTDLDLAKTQNKTYIYQPFKSANQLVQKFDGKNNNRLLTVNDVDTYSSIATAEDEFSINLDALPAIIYDKYIQQMVKI